LLVSIGAPRLRRSGIEVPQPLSDAHHRLYERLAAEDPDAAHGRDNAARAQARQLRAGC